MFSNLTSYLWGGTAASAEDASNQGTDVGVKTSAEVGKTREISGPNAGLEDLVIVGGAKDEVELLPEEEDWLMVDDTSAGE